MRTFLFFLFGLPALAFGQDSTRFEPNPPPVRPTIVSGPVLKVAPLSLLDIDPTVQGAIEAPLKPALSIQQEIGYGWPRLGIAPYQREEFFQQKSTFRARTEIRYYISPELRKQYKDRVVPAGVYAAGEFLYKKMTTGAAQNRSTATQPPVGSPNSTLRTEPVNRHVYGLHAKIGYQGTLSSKKPRFIVDIYVGVGFRVISVRQANDSLIPGFQPIEPLRLNRFEPFAGTLRKPSLAGGVKIGWLITTEKKIKKK